MEADINTKRQRQKKRNQRRLDIYWSQDIVIEYYENSETLLINSVPDLHGWQRLVCNCANRKQYIQQWRRKFLWKQWLVNTSEWWLYKWKLDGGNVLCTIELDNHRLRRLLSSNKFRETLLLLVSPLCCYGILLCNEWPQLLLSKLQENVRQWWHRLSRRWVLF